MKGSRIGVEVVQVLIPSLIVFVGLYYLSYRVMKVEWYWVLISYVIFSALILLIRNLKK